MDSDTRSKSFLPTIISGRYIRLVARGNVQPRKLRGEKDWRGVKEQLTEVERGQWQRKDPPSTGTKIDQTEERNTPSNDPQSI